MKLVISAGGTGGHIFPGIAVAEALLAQDRANDVVFIGTTYGLEGKIIPQAGFRLLYIEAHQFLGTSPLHKVGTVLRLLKGISMATGILRSERPDAILGMGGFTSVPVVIAGVILGVPCFIHEQNVQPGLANRLLSKITRSTFISFEETKNYLSSKKVRHTGNPLRKNLKAVDVKKPEDRFSIFVFGGSRGAKSINDSILTLLPFLESYKNTVMYHQTGAGDYERVSDGYKNTGIEHEVFPFIDDMAKYYSLADVVISRAGATTIFELAYFRKAAILIPYPYSAGGHQWKNASQVEQAGGGYVIGDDEATGDRLFDVLKHLMKEPGLLKEMGENIGRIYVQDAAERIIGGIADGIS
ncbi:MAG: UDP-N-acetylglucosamine--N-acetylmuramyl-(pentapeptide) pyrophosphoryl-undecaprenol N-acetylglucosamine transferase [Syntrophorhabdus sp. PtaU1.Bin058]|nr:MAG: UDP-N-acetylglucosamine--N-acetylmuramyl-(pentapeptide) pyrophosphoryl-undecaprenol N-acetylglucosamine transferase [Syntrophorhabdus sp. PtaU1.Bin058]